MKHTVEIDTAVDLRTLEQMGAEEYLQYIENELMYVDHHDVLRSQMAGYLIAATQEQLDILVKHLQELRHKLKA